MAMPAVAHDTSVTSRCFQVCCFQLRFLILIKFKATVFEVEYRGAEAEWRLGCTPVADDNRVGDGGTRDREIELSVRLRTALDR
jgi:hypothetical protein